MPDSDALPTDAKRERMRYGTNLFLLIYSYCIATRWTDTKNLVSRSSRLERHSRSMSVSITITTGYCYGSSTPRATIHVSAAAKMTPMIARAAEAN
jgi:hypothetical protein